MKIGKGVPGADSGKEPVYDKKLISIAFGGSLYWASSILLLTSWRSPAAAGDPFPFYAGFTHFALGLVLCLLLGCSRAFRERRFQVLLGAGGIASTAVVLVLGALPGLPDDAAATVGIAATALYHACYVLFWGLNFAVLDKKDAEKTVFLTMLAAFAIYLSCCWIPVGENGFLAAGAMKALSLIPFFSGSYDLPVADRPVQAGQLPMLVPFFLSRAFFGLALGVLFCLSEKAEAVPRLSPVLLAAAAALVLYAVRAARAPGPAGTVLRVTPLVILGFVALPFLGSGFGFGSGSTVLVSSAAVWLSWIVLSSVQVSDLKERIGIDEVRLPFAEKAAVMLSLAVGYMAATFVPGLLGDGAAAAFETLSPAVLGYLSILVSSYVFSDLIDTKERQRLVDRALALSETKMKRIYEDVSREYHLTEREREVLVLMAQGRTRPYIREALCVSEGTVRSHANHIYQKIGIHSREELIDLIEKKKESFNQEKPSL